MIASYATCKKKVAAPRVLRRAYSVPRSKPPIEDMPVRTTVSLRAAVYVAAAMMEDEQRHRGGFSEFLEDLLLAHLKNTRPELVASCAKRLAAGEYRFSGNMKPLLDALAKRGDFPPQAQPGPQPLVKGGPKGRK